MKQYEAMFLFDPSFANEFANVEKEIQRIMQRAEAQIIQMTKWDERKLAFEIKGRKRGCYVLVFFKTHPTKIENMERDCRLSESILRVLITRVEEASPEHIERAISQAPAFGRGHKESSDDVTPRTESVASSKAETKPAGGGVAVAEATEEAPKATDEPKEPKS